MNIKVPYLKWRERINRLIPDNLRIGDDVFIVPQEMVFDFPSEYYKTDVITVVICERGWVKISVNMKEYILKSPCVFTQMPNTTCRYIEHSEDLLYRVVIMSQNFSNNLFFSIEHTHPLRTSIEENPFIEGEETVRIYIQYLKLLMDLVQKSDTPYKLEVARHLTMSLFYSFSWSKHLNILEPEVKSRKKIHFNNFAEMVRKNFRIYRDVAFYADKLCITVKYLTEIVKEQTGQSALEFISKYVIIEAKALLLSTTLSIQQIADTLNFPSQSVFGKYFKRETGISPRQYRQKTLF